MRHFDVAVIGAGVGGGSAALALRKAGLSVVLLESGAVGRHKVCGEFLSPESRLTFERLGVWNDFLAAGALPTKAARILTSQRIGGSWKFATPGVALSRATMDTVLWQACQREGVVTEEKCRVSAVNPQGQSGFEIHSAAGDFEVRFVVDATGRNGHFKGGEERRELKNGSSARFIGFKTHFRGANVQPGEVAMFPYKGGYCGLVNIEGGLVNACCLLDYADSQRRSPAELWNELREQNKQLAQATDGAQPVFEWIATGNVSFNRFAPAGEGILRVGDAAGYIHPLSGDGMAMAARAGELAAQTIGEIGDSGQASMRYAGLWQREFGRRLRVASCLQPLFVRPRLTGAALELFNRFPVLAHQAITLTRS